MYTRLHKLFVYFNQLSHLETMHKTLPFYGQEYIIKSVLALCELGVLPNSILLT